ncbi:MAG TPA: glycosyltransferase, partial [Caulobacteraceae bacterium]|nr:glycosyltransferase [Caulobacteraceae bacterium]
FATQLRAVSETFIRRHLEDLAPGETVAVCRMIGTEGPAPCPAFLAERWALRLPVRLACRAGADRQTLLLAAVGRFLRQREVSHVLGEYLDQFLDFVPLLRRLGLPFVVQGHGLDVSAALQDPAIAERYGAYASAKAVLTRSEFHRRRLIALGLPAAKVHVNPGGVDIPSALPARDPQAGKRLLAIGRMIPKKSPILLLESFRLAAQADPGLTLDYVGDGPLFAAARDFVRACELEERVRLHGSAPEAEKLRLLGECGVFVQHSVTDLDTGDEEGLPAAIQEAMAYGLAVVSTRHAGIPEAVIHGESGLLVGEGDVRGMAEALRAVPARAAEFGAAGRRRAAACYGWEHERARLRGWLFDEVAA